MFINAEPIFGILSSYRLIWICGKFGGHKTALSLAMTENFLKQGYRLVTNNRNVWQDKLDDVNPDQDGHLKAVVLLDEGGLYFKSSRQVEQIASYAAKMDCIYIIPSFWPPARAAQVITIQPLFSLKSAGLPVIFYKWRVDIGGFHDKGWFIWLFPQEIYGIYSRQDPGDDPENIIEYLIKQTENYRTRYGRKNAIRTLETVKPEDIYADAIDEFSQTADDLTTLFSRKRGKR